MESAFDSLLNTTVVISTSGPTSRSLHGVETYSTAGDGSTYRARYVEKREEIRGPHGEVIVQTGTLWVDSTANMSTKARVYVNQVSKAFPVIAVERFPDENGQHHVRLRLGHGGGDA